MTVVMFREVNQVFEPGIGRMRVEEAGSVVGTEVGDTVRTTGLFPPLKPQALPGVQVLVMVMPESV